MARYVWNHFDQAADMVWIEPFSGHYYMELSFAPHKAALTKHEAIQYWHDMTICVTWEKWDLRVLLVWKRTTIQASAADSMMSRAKLRVIILVNIDCLSYYTPDIGEFILNMTQKMHWRMQELCPIADW